MTKKAKPCAKCGEPEPWYVVNWDADYCPRCGGCGSCCAGHICEYCGQEISSIDEPDAPEVA